MHNILYFFWVKCYYRKAPSHSELIMFLVLLLSIISNFIIYHFEVVNHIFECNKLQEPVQSSSIHTILTTDLSADSTLIHSPGWYLFFMLRLFSEWIWRHFLDRLILCSNDLCFKIVIRLGLGLICVWEALP